MAIRDVKKLKKQFDEISQKTGMSLIEFCMIRGLNFSDTDKKFKSIDGKKSNIDKFTEDKIDFYAEKHRIGIDLAKFIKAYFETGNKQKAAEITGIDERKARRLFEQEHVQNALADISETYAENETITPERLTGRMAIIANANIKDYFVEGGQGALIMPDQWTRKQALAVKKFTISPTKYGDRIELELYSAIDAMEKLAKPLRLFSEPEKDDAEFAQMTDEDIKAEIEALTRDLSN